MTKHHSSLRDVLRIAHAAGWDAAHRRMLAQGRSTWNREDHDTATDTCRAVLAAHGWSQDDGRNGACLAELTS